MSRPIKRVIASVISIIIAVAFATGIGYIYLKNMQQYMQEDTNRSLSEISNQSARLVKQKVTSDIAYLKDIGRFISENMDSEERVISMIDNGAGASNFRSISFADNTGYVYHKKGTPIYSVAQREYFQKAIEGKTTIYTGVTSIENGNTEVVLIAVPVYADHQIVGAVLGQYDAEEFNKLLSITTFGGKGYNYICYADGRIFVWAEHKDVNRSFYSISYDLSDVPMKKENALPQMLTNMAQHKSGEIMYFYHGEDRIMNYTPIGINDWYLLSVVPQEVVTSKTSHLFVQALLFMALVMVCMLVVILFILYLRMKDEQKSRMNQERVDIILEQTKDIIFEWNLKTNKVYYSHIFAEKFGYEAVNIGFPYGAVQRGDIYKDDIKAYLELFDQIRNGEKTVSQDIRIRMKNGDFVWCKVRGTSVMDDKDRPIRFIGVISDIEAQKRQILAIEDTARRDGLTSLYNRKSTEMFVNDYITTKKEDAVFIMLDIDNFKHINDTLGHAYGDMVLSQLAEALKNIFRAHDIIGRIGGDEFAVFLHHMSDSQVLKHKLEDILKAFQKRFYEEGSEYKVSCSIGVAHYPQDGESYSELYEKADIALYFAKESGKNQYAYYSCQLLLDRQWRNGTESLNKLNSGQLLCYDNLGRYVARVLEEYQDVQKLLPQLLTMIDFLFHIEHVYIITSDSKTGSLKVHYEWFCDYIKNDSIPCKEFEETIWKHEMACCQQHPVFYYKYKEDRVLDRLINADDRQVDNALWCLVSIDGIDPSLICFDHLPGKDNFSNMELYMLPMLARYISGAVCHLIDTKQVYVAKDAPPIMSYIVDVETWELLSPLPHDVSTDHLCYQVLWGYDKPCKHCPLLEEHVKGCCTMNIHHGNGPMMHMTFTIMNKDGRDMALIFCQEMKTNN